MQLEKSKIMQMQLNLIKLRQVLEINSKKNYFGEIIMKISKVYQNKNLIDIVSENPFFILSLSSLDDTDKMNQQEDYIKKKLRLGIDYQPEYSEEILIEKNINESNLHNQLFDLKDTDKKIINRVFWFFEPYVALTGLSKEDTWNRANILLEEEEIEFKHDGALLALIYLFQNDKDIDQFENWIFILNQWKDILENKKILELVIKNEDEEFITFSEQDILDLTIQITFTKIAKIAISQNKIKVFSKIIELIKAISYGDRFINELFLLLESNFQNIKTDLISYRKDMSYEKDSLGNYRLKNKELCNNAYKKYLDKIEPILIITFLYLNQDDIIRNNLKEEAAEILKNLSIDFSWASKFNKCYETAVKGLQLAKKLPVEYKLIELKKQFKSYQDKTLKKQPEIIFDGSLVNNPFRLLDLSVDSSKKEINMAIKELKIKRKYKFNRNLNLSWDLKFISYNDKSFKKLSVRKKNSWIYLVNDYEKLKSQLFWFFNREEVIKDLDEEELLEIANYWYRTDSTTEKHDAALLALIYLFKNDQKFNNIEEWHKALNYWNAAAKDIAEYLFENIQGGKIKNIIKKSANTIMVEQIINLIKESKQKDLKDIKSNLYKIIVELNSLNSFDQNNIFNLLFKEYDLYFTNESTIEDNKNRKNKNQRKNKTRKDNNKNSKANPKKKVEKNNSSSTYKRTNLFIIILIILTIYILVGVN